MLNAREYQQLAIDNCFEIFKTKQSALIVLFTGGGKTITFAHLIKQMQERTGKRALVLAHRGELIEQAADKIQRSTGLTCDIEMADSYAHTWDSMKSDVVVATVQTITQEHRLERFDPSEFGLIVTDESHHATSASYRRIYDYFLQDNPECKHLGVTATPDRSDEEALGQIYDDVALDYGIADGVAHGWLCGVEQQVVEVESLDLSRCGTRMGDIASSDLNAIVEQESVLHEMAIPTMEIAGDRKTLFFASSVSQAEQMCEIFNRYRPGSTEVVSGKTSKDVRADIVKRYYNNELWCLCNVGVFVEGFDDPGVEVIADGSPTKSRSRYAQKFGRMTRPAEEIASELNNHDEQGRLNLIANSSKPKALMIDFAGNAGRHKLVTAADILGGKYSDEVIQLAVENNKKRQKPEDVMTELARAEAELAARHKREQEALEREGIKFGAKYYKYDVSPFDVLDITPSRIPGYIKTKPMSSKQRDLLEKWGIPNVDQIQNTIHASQILGKIPPSDKQKNILRRAGLPVDKINRFAANKIMGILAKNKWRLNDGSRAVIDKIIKEAS